MLSTSVDLLMTFCWPYNDQTTLHL